MTTEYVGLNPSRLLAGGERLQLIVERDPPLLGMSRIDTVSEAWDHLGESRWFFVVWPSRETVAMGDQRVGAITVRARAEAAQARVPVSTAIDEAGTHLGFMRIRRVDAVDVKAATDTSKQAETVAQEKSEGAGQTPIQKAATAAKQAGTAAATAFTSAFSFVKLAVVGVIVVGAVILAREVKGFRT